MEAYIVIVVAFGLVILLVLCLLFFVNRLTLMKLEVENQFSSIKDYAKERASIYEKIVVFLKEKYPKEEVFIKRIEKSIHNLNHIEMASDGIPTLKESHSIFLQYQKLVEFYQELKKDKTYLELKKEYEENVDRIQYASVSYDKGVENYNSYRENGIVSKIGDVLHFPVYDYYSA